MNKKVSGLNSYHFSVGKIKLIVISDGFENIHEHQLGDTFKSMPDGFAQAFAQLPQPYPFGYNVLYLETGGERVLIDVGLGAMGKPDFGFFLERLEQESISASQIDKIILSHLHLDHTAALTAENSPVFANAQIFLPRLEWEHWIESGRAPAERAEILKKIFQPYQERLHFIEDGDVAAEGVTVIALPGHTPGHCGFMIESAGERLLHMVDTLHFQTQIAFPDVSPFFDINPELSPKTRRMVLQRLADEALLALTYHLPFPGLGHVAQAKDSAGFIWKPIERIAKP
ncbi:MAG: MBL fold metallo-hydrolase [Anaerolineaceae bacterium]|nr:MBL fold metallo-hydrolase [Anaerolineaceae bacterium]